MADELNLEAEREFEAWWEKEGQFIRAGGGKYEKSFAYRAWMDSRAAPAAQLDREWVQKTWFECNQHLYAFAQAIASRRTEPAAAQLDAELPPLPTPAHSCPDGKGGYFKRWTIEQVRQVQREVAMQYAERIRQMERELSEAKLAPMCERKTDHIMQRDGYEKTGYVLKKSGERICVSDGGAVAWFTLDQWNWLMFNRDHVEFDWPKPYGRTAGTAPEAAPVAWAVTAERGGIHKLSITRESAERKATAWREEWPDNGCKVRPLVFADAAAPSPQENTK